MAANSDASRNKKPKSFIKNSAVISAGMLLGRFTGIVRESATIYFLGTTLLSDLAVLTLTFPDLLQGIILGGALGGALIPQFVLHRRTGGEKAEIDFLAQSMLGVFVYSLVCAILAYLFLDQIAIAIAPGFSTRDKIALEGLLTITLCQIPITAVAGMFSTWLQYKESFAAIASTTPIVNLVSIFFVYLLSRQTTEIYLLACGVMIASSLRLAILYYASMKWAYFGRMNLPIIKNAFGRLRYFFSDNARALCKAIGASFFILLTPVAVRSMASLGGLGDLTVLNFAMKIVELPVGLIGTVVSVVLLPVIAKQSSGTNESDGALQTGYLYLALQLCIPIAFAFFLMKKPIVDVVNWLTGSTSDVTVEVVEMSAILLWSSVPLVAIATLTTFAQASRNLALPLFVGALSFTLKIILGISLFRYAGIRGMGFGLVASDYIAMITMVYAFRTRGLDLACRSVGYGRYAKVILGWLVISALATFGEEHGIEIGFLVTFIVLSGGFITFFAVKSSLQELK